MTDYWALGNTLPENLLVILASKSLSVKLYEGYPEST